MLTHGALAVRRASVLMLTACLVTSLSCEVEGSFRGHSESEWAEQLRSPNYDQRFRAAYALSNIDSRTKGTIAALVAALPDTNALIQRLVVAALARAGGRASPAIRSALADDHASVRAAAARALGALNDDDDSWPANVDALTRALGDPDPEVREAVVPALSSSLIRHGSALGDKVTTFESTFDSLSHDRDVRIRESALRGLAELRSASPVTRAAVQRALADSEQFIRQAAVDVARTIPGTNPEGVPTKVLLLLAALGDAAPGIRLRAVDALADMGPAAVAARPRLVIALQDADSIVRRVAKDAIDALDGKPRASPPVREPTMQERCRAGAARPTDRC